MKIFYIRQILFLIAWIIGYVGVRRKCVELLIDKSETEKSHLVSSKVDSYSITNEIHSEFKMSMLVLVP